MLTVDQIEVAYDNLQVLFGLSFSVQAGEILCLLGRNGAGKTTSLKAVMGLLPLQAGSVSMHGKSLNAIPAHEIPRQGIAYVPQGRGLFPELSVGQNMQIGLMAGKSPKHVLEQVLLLFPRLQERLHQRAETLSGGEQQMLAMARAMCMQPEVILLDEPTEGLQPSMIELVRDVIIQLKADGVAVVLVEQQVEAVLSIADRVAFVEHGKIPETVRTHQLRDNPSKITRSDPGGPTR